MRESRRTDSIWPGKTGQDKHVGVLKLIVDILCMGMSARRQEDVVESEKAQLNCPVCLHTQTPPFPIRPTTRGVGGRNDHR